MRRSPLVRRRAGAPPRPTRSPRRPAPMPPASSSAPDERLDSATDVVLPDIKEPGRDPGLFAFHYCLDDRSTTRQRALVLTRSTLTASRNLQRVWRYAAFGTRLAPFRGPQLKIASSRLGGLLRSAALSLSGTTAQTAPALQLPGEFRC